MYMQKFDPQVPHIEARHTGKFAEIRRNILKIQENWDAFYQLFLELDSPFNVEFQRHDLNFSTAVSKLLTALETPTLTLATTGTTSSGKSTLINLLCGADIMPRMVKEMSAGIVTIKHASDGKRLLKIKQTANAVWECGEWEDLDDYNIRTRLTKTMDAFNKVKNKCELVSPIIELTYPVACFSPHTGMLDLSDLPAGTQFQLMDLPGKRNQDDQINSSIIQSCRNALSIVTYDMAETDETKTQGLMKEVLEQVKLMGGSPARMLFALNRIDVFRKDPDWESRAKDAAEQAEQEIKDILYDNLPEHREVLNTLSFSKLSSLPALLAWQLKNSEREQQDKAAEQIDEHFKFMLSSELKEDLPRSVKSWDENDFHQVDSCIWENSYAGIFFSTLDNHIRDNFVKLIVAPLLVEFEETISKIIDSADRVCIIGVESGRKQFEEIKTQLDIDYDVITDNLNRYYEDLTLLPRFIKNNPIILEQLDSIAYMQGAEFDVLRESDVYKSNIKSGVLSALSDSVAEPFRWLGGISEGATQSLKAGHAKFTGTTAEMLHYHHEDKLRVICQNLIGAGYNNEMAKKGSKESKAVSNGEKKEMDKLLVAVETYGSKLSSLMQEVYCQRLERENVRIKNLLEKVVETFLEVLNDYFKLQNFRLKVKYSHALLDKINLDIPLIEFNIDLDKRIDVERNPWSLWFGKREVGYANIPSADDLHEVLVDYLREIRKEAVNPLVRAIEEYYEDIHVKMTYYIGAVKADVRAKFEKTFQEHKGKYQQQEENWMVLRSLVSFMSSDMQTLLTYKA